MFFVGAFTSQLPVILLAILYVLGMANLYSGKNVEANTCQDKVIEHQHSFQNIESASNSINFFDILSIDNCCNYADLELDQIKLDSYITGKILVADFNTFFCLNVDGNTPFLRPPPFID